ncbi:putative enzyme related to lactoylglutathione lyase [Psychromicrobium silvestre]|uniref:Putative enzyme related to lactoylglutathione lyase n=1 Tax=Psychromicrobium silvestre TaxID=1645614 RepID=A0A7Y9LR19_9MICC|nr:VOC family protein [Psychromicrobium silvestre]NYE94015.1 putative enzyme related to lactoylglutathione lyase [Psychromicrobium silvestre]
MPELSSIMINALDARKLAEFWSAFLNTEIAADHEDFIWLKATEDQSRLAFQQVAEPTEGRRRLHLDFTADDPERELARALELGASQLEDHTSGSFHWVVLADPEGNEFCLSAAE